MSLSMTGPQQAGRGEATVGYSMASRLDTLPDLCSRAYLPSGMRSDNQSYSMNAPIDLASVSTPVMPAASIHEAGGSPEEAQALLLRAARSWQEDHREWQKRYNQWLLERNEWESRRVISGEDEAVRQKASSSSRMVSGTLMGAMKRAVFAGRKATILAYTKAANKTKTRLVPAAKRIAHRLGALGNSRRSPPEQQLDEEKALHQHHQQLLLLRLQQQRLLEEQVMQQQQRELLMREVLQQEHQQQVLQRQEVPHQHRQMLEVPELKQRKLQQNEQQTVQRTSQQKQQQQSEEEELPSPRTAQTSPNTSMCEPKIKESKTTVRAPQPSTLSVNTADLSSTSEWADEGDVLDSINSSIDWIVDVGLSPSARAAAVAALQRREMVQQNQKCSNEKTGTGEGLRGSSRDTCCDSVGSAEVLPQGSTHRLLSREKPILQRAKPHISNSHHKHRSQKVVLRVPRTYDSETDCSLEDCVIHNESSSDTAACDSSSSNTSYLARSFRAARKLRAAAAAAKRRQIALAQRRAQAAKREELCYSEIGFDCAL